MPQRILVVDDDHDTTRTFQRLLTAHGFLVREENDSRNVLRTAREFQPDVVILDFLMPPPHGAELAWKLAGDVRLRETPRVILCSGVPTGEFELKLPPIKIEIVEKPVDGDMLLQLLHEVQVAG